jgi:putative cardiolipin synthase
MLLMGLKNTRFVLLYLVLLSTLSSCATINFDEFKEASYAPPPSTDTFLGRKIEPLMADGKSGQSAFHVVGEGVEALALRISGAARAEQSIDVQTYLIKNDTTSKLFVGALLKAADEGVRVRLLLDDVFTGGVMDDALAVLNSHALIQVRIINPFARRRFRALDGLTDFGRVNRRMHNKTFTIDNQISILGGRNIADEYFSAHPGSEFLDTEVLAFGPIVPEISDMFDTYWNHRLAVPVDQFLNLPDDLDAANEKLRAAVVEAFNEVSDTEYGESLISRIWENHSTFDQVVWADYELVYDSPDKLDASLAQNAESMLPPLEFAIVNAEQELLVISPYFVPREAGIGFLRETVNRGLDVKVLTNSLAANNHWIVHSGYAPSRKALLRAGVELYESRPDIPYEDDVPETFRSEVTTLHTKAMIIDRRQVFIGSFNWDPRSLNLNTEMGVIIDSPELGEFYSQRARSELPWIAYKVALDERDKLIWVTEIDGKDVVYTKEPKSSFSQRFLSRLASILPIKGQL